MSLRDRLPVCVRSLLACAGLTLAAAGAHAVPGTPVYSTTVTDAVTAPNAFTSGGFRFWTITPGADSYQNDVYERPVASGFNLIGGRYAANEYLSYVDIESARFGYDNRFLYAAINVVGLTKQTQDGVNTIEGLQGRYAVRFGADPDGRNSIYLIADQPQSAALPNTAWTLAKTEGFRDTDRDVGGRGGPIHGQPGPSGLAVTKIDNILEEAGLNGYDQQFISTDGITVNGQRPVLWQRVSPTDNTVIEIALDYVTAGLTRAQLDAIQYLHFEAQTGNLADPQFGLWNDQFTGIEAGSPNLGIGTDNQFGTQGLGAIYEVDTVRGSITPPPAQGACCTGTACSIAFASACTAPGQVFRGVGTVCAPATCCTADFDSSGAVTPQDVFAYINAYFTGDLRADINRDGVLTPTDFFAFLNAYFAGC
jgi:hypothetical protein